ncbi:MAG: hypothetical protein KIT31_39805, partial [Deltaproteobacteria bacterium]|nr:hypothetical protein [Deltaproteobacteria bacterium]
MPVIPPYADASEHLADHLARLAWLLDDHDSLEPLWELDAAIEAREDATAEMLPLLMLRGLGGLDPAAVHVLVAAAAPMLGGEVGRTVRDRIAGMTPTVEELVALLGGSPEDDAILRAALDPEAPLVALGLVALAGEGVPPHLCNVVVEARVAAFLRGDDVFDAALRGIAELHRALELPVPAPGAAIVEHVLQTPGPIVVEGGANSGKATAVIAAAARAGKRAIVVDVEALAASPEPLALLRRARREALLHHAVLIARARTWSDAIPSALRRELLHTIQAGDAVAATRDGDALCRQLRGARRIRLALPTPAEQVALW